MKQFHSFFWNATPCLFTLGAVGLAISAAEIACAEPPPADSATALFDGKTLAGWEGNAEIFRVRDGAIVAGSASQRIAHNEFLATKKSYTNFDLRLEAQLVGEGKNAGVQFRSRRIPNHHEVKGYQCDMGQMQGKSIWGWLYDESRRRKFLAKAADSKAAAAKFREQDWNKLRIRCEGPRIQIWVNDIPTVDYREPQADIPQSGIIALQIHGGPPAEASYRNIMIQELPE